MSIIYGIAYGLMYGLTACNLTFYFAGIVREHLVPGTRLRYVLATAQWTLALPAFAIPVLLVLTQHYVTGPFNFLMTAWCLYDLYKSDDDNWFRRKRKQLKRYLTVTRLQPAGSRA